MTDHPHVNEEHELPCIEAVLAGTLALMTGYGQALQAALEPQRRLSMGEKVARNLSLLAEHPQLSVGFRQVLTGLQRRWIAMNDCTEQAAGPFIAPPPRAALRFQVEAPKRLQ